MENLHVNVTMYPVGELGDCFLLDFIKGNVQTSVLIDCGSFRNGAEAKTRMNTVAKEIQINQQVNGTIRAIDVVVATHQHNDHLSGFAHCNDIFNQIGIEHAWLSWLDKPTDGHAGSIAAGERKLVKKLSEISRNLYGLKGMKKSTAATRINEILGFYGYDNQQPANAPLIPLEGLNNLRTIAQTTSYLYPGNVIDLPNFGQEEVKVYVLGPPKDNNLLFKTHPGHGESYEDKLAVAMNVADGFLSALTNFSDTTLTDESYFPFSNSLNQPISQSKFLNSSYNLEKEKWRCINEDWLDQAERLALYLDSYTNNSSLVLAFELVKSEKVLLFVGDAQTGSWLSWKTLDFGPANLQLDQLLRNTVLYKVGHHGSHNATLPECLEKMTHKELVAMIPVDISDANIRKKNGWKMPAAKLYQRIKELTNGRILRMDGKYESNCDVVGDKFLENWGELHKNLRFKGMHGDREIITYRIS